MVTRGAAELEEKRLAALEECIALELAAGAHDPSSRSCPRWWPTIRCASDWSVSSWWRSTGPAGAARRWAAYRRLATRLAGELGIDPSARLRALWEDHAGRSRTGRHPTPAQLPSDVAGFTGRVVDLSRLDRRALGRPAHQAVIISAIAGSAGVGKTRARRPLGHRMRDKFADGQLYVNLRGYAQGPPLTPRSTRWPDSARARGARRGGAHRGRRGVGGSTGRVLADRRVLVLLDNAADAEQVRPLLPGSSTCLVLVTSRDDLTELVDRDRGPAGHRRRARAGRGVRAAEPRPRSGPGGGRTGGDRGGGAAVRVPSAGAADRGREPRRHRERGRVRRPLSAGNRLAVLEVDGDRLAAVRAAFDLSFAALGRAGAAAVRAARPRAGPRRDGGGRRRAARHRCRGSRHGCSTGSRRRT
jgi:hypothetical protein